MRILKIVGAIAIFFVLLFITQQSRAASNGPCVALTFDDGPDPVLTPRLVQILRTAGVPATFFEIGRSVATYPEVTKMVHDAGFPVENHSWSHPKLTQLSDAAVASEINRTSDAIFRATGEYPRYFRAPYGDRSARVEKDAGLPDVLWDIDTNDWRYVNNSARVENVAAHSGSGIILMHDIHAWTIDAVPGLIATLRAEGATFVTVPEYYNGGCGQSAPTVVATTPPRAAPATAATQVVLTKPVAVPVAPPVETAAPAEPTAPRFPLLHALFGGDK